MFLVWPGTETCANFGYDWCVHLLCNVAEYYIYFALFSLVISASKRCNCADIFMMGRGMGKGELFFKRPSADIYLMEPKPTVLDGIFAIILHMT